MLGKGYRLVFVRNRDSAAGVACRTAGVLLRAGNSEPTTASSARASSCDRACGRGGRRAEKGRRFDRGTCTCPSDASRNTSGVTLAATWRATRWSGSSKIGNGKPWADAWAAADSAVTSGSE